MKPQWQEVNDYLTEQLKREDIGSEHRTHIEGTLAFLEHEKNKGKEDWKQFVKRIKSKLKEWKERFPVEGYVYILHENEFNGLKNLSLSLKGKTYSTWLVKVNSFQRPQNETFISTIQSHVDDISILTLNDVDTYIEKMFTSNSFKEEVEFAKSQL